MGNGYKAKLNSFFMRIAAGVGFLTVGGQLAVAEPVAHPVQGFEAAREAKELVESELFQFASVHTVGISYCDKWWAHTLLGKDIPPESPQPKIGVSVGFSDYAELVTFARTAVIFGSFVTTSKGDVLLCADFGSAPVPQPVSGGSSQ